MDAVPSTSGATPESLPEEEFPRSAVGPSSSGGGGNESLEPTVRQRLYVEEVANFCNIGRLVRELGTEEQCQQFSLQHHLLPSQKLCRSHRSPMCLDTSHSLICNYKCRKGRCRSSSFTISWASGTWFENVKITMVHVIYLMYCFAHRMAYEDVICEDFSRADGRCLSLATICDWYSYSRETVVEYQLRRQTNRGKIGGPGKIVQIDERKFGKRKYNRGRHIEGHWVLGMIEDGSEDLRLVICPHNVRSAEVLVLLIKEHVAEGTTIHTDYWRAYDCLGQHGYIHKKVNHSDPDNPFVAEDGTHTQRIVSMARCKTVFRKENYNNPADFADIIVEYLWRRETLKHHKDPGNCLHFDVIT